jgi:hypothetical protein
MLKFELGLTLARQAHYHLNHSISPFFYVGYISRTLFYMFLSLPAVPWGFFPLIGFSIIIVVTVIIIVVITTFYFSHL